MKRQATIGRDESAGRRPAAGRSAAEAADESAPAGGPSPLSALPPAHMPLWSQVKSALIARIHEEGLGEHAKLPSEHELCAEFGVSRTVVREALNQLVNERVIYKLQGKGAFVASQREEQDFLGTSAGFSGELLGKQKVIARQVLRQTVTDPHERGRHLLKLAAGQKVISLDRVLHVDGMPRIIVRTLIPEALAPGLDQVNMQNRSLYDTLRRQYGIVVKRADRWLEALMPTREDAALLGAPVDQPVIGIESCAYTASGDPVEYYTGVYRSDRARLHFRVG